MTRKIRLPVRALGSEWGDPSLPELATWIAAHRGIEADLTTFKLDTSLHGQERVNIPAAGGKFYMPRILASLVGIDGLALNREPAIDERYVISDTEQILTMRKDAWCALPAPHLWNITDRYFHDQEEFAISLCQCAKQLMRSMRDRGMKGHILLCDRYIEEEAEELAGANVRFYAENPPPGTLPILLEYQRTLAIPSDQVKRALGLLDEFDITCLTVVDPTESALKEVQAQLDPGSFEAGGYCKSECAEYWDQIVDSAFILR